MRRTKLDVIYDILDAVYKKGEIKITHLMYKANLSYNKLKEYLEKLEKNDMIEIKNNMISLKPKGMQFLREYYRIKEFAKSFGLDE